MKRILLFLVATAFLVEAHQLHGAENVINSIVGKNWSRWSAKQKSLSIEVDHSIPSLANHNCIHDSHIVPKFREQLSKKLLEHKSKIEATGMKEFEQRKEQMKKTAWTDFRTALKTDLIEGKNSDKYACNEKGNKVYEFTTGKNYLCQDDDVLSNNAQAYLRELVLPTLAEAFGEIIQVQFEGGNLILNQLLGDECWPGVNIPTNYFDEGVPNATFVVFATARPCEDYVVAYATACNYEVFQEDPPIVGRPLAGLINFCPQYFHPAATAFEFQSTVKVALHELTHALGFASDFYDSYIDTNGNRWANPTITETKSGNSAAGQSYNVEVVKLATPQVVQYAKDYFDCNNINGVELEDYGGAGTAGSHWELRVLGDEFMCGYVNPSMPVSGFTLSLFNDMGWYRSNKNAGEYHGWGKGLGCGFVNSRCETSWPNFDGYWCNPANDDTDILTCSADRKSKGKCEVYQYDSQLPAYYQHFTNPTYGGPISAADYCPFVGQWQNKYPPFCEDADEEGDASVFEHFGASSACFPLTTSAKHSPKCYQVHCASEDLLQVIIQNVTFNCPVEGGSLSINSVISGGSLDCPPAYMMCAAVDGYTSNATVIVSEGEWSGSANSLVTFGVLEIFATISAMLIL